MHLLMYIGASTLAEIVYTSSEAFGLGRCTKGKYFAIDGRNRPDSQRGSN